MNFLKALWAIIEELFSKEKDWYDNSEYDPPTAPTSPVTASNPPIPLSVPSSSQEANNGLDWSTQKGAYHAVRVMCDNAGLTLEQKNEVCATIMGESQFYNDVVNHNRNSKGVVTSTDWGICQINDYFHIGNGKDFVSVEYVLANPDKCVAWMINMYKAGKIDMWCAHQNKSYLKWLSPDSRMWAIPNS